MLDFVVAVLVVLYALALTFVLFHSFTDAHLIYHYLVSCRKRKKILPALCIPPHIYSHVTMGRAIAARYALTAISSYSKP